MRWLAPISKCRPLINKERHLREPFCNMIVTRHRLQAMSCKTQADTHGILCR